MRHNPATAPFSSLLTAGLSIAPVVFGSAPAAAQAFPSVRICCTSNAPLLVTSKPPAIHGTMVAFAGERPTSGHAGAISPIGINEQFTILVQEGQPSPLHAGVHWHRFTSPVLHRGEAVFGAFTFDGTAGHDGLFSSTRAWADTYETPGAHVVLPMDFTEQGVLYQHGVDVVLAESPGSLRTLLRVGDAAPGGDIIGLFVEFSMAENIAAYKVNIQRGPETYGNAILVQNLTTGQLRRLVDWNTSLPGLGAHRYLRWAQTDGDFVYFVAGRPANATEPVMEGLFRIPVTSGPPELLAMSGDAAPGGGVFSEFAPFSPIQTSAGQVVFEAPTNPFQFSVLSLTAFAVRNGIIERVIGNGDFLDGQRVSTVLMGPQALDQGRLALLVNMVTPDPFTDAATMYVFDIWPCRADLTGSSDPSARAYGRRDGEVDIADFFYYLDRFVAADTLADLTTVSDPSDPAYGVPDGILDVSDLFYYLDLFTTPCG